MFSTLINKCIRAYQLFISPLFGQHCRYYPSCSEYTRQAIEQHGFLTGARMGAWRIIRCNPFSLGGVDHVPGTCEHSQTSQNPPHTSS